MPPHPLSQKRGARQSREPRQSLPQWPCLLPNIAVAVTPLRNFTGDPKQQFLADDLTDHLVMELFRRCRGFSFGWLPGERPWAAGAGPTNRPEFTYLVSGSVQRGDPLGMLRVNMRISDAVTADYLWAGRQEFRREDFTSIQTEITRRISRMLHVLVLQEASRRVFPTSDAELEVTECLARARAVLREELRADLSAKAQKWFLAAFARDARSVEALVGLVLTCQHLVSNPWWSDHPRAAAAAADLGREAVTIALELEPGNARAKCIQGMLYSAAGQLEEAGSAFCQALAMDEAAASAYAFGGYNAALLGRAWETLPAVELAMRLNPAFPRPSICLFFGGFAELLLSRMHEAVTLLQKSLEHNPSYGCAQLFLMAALSMSARHDEAALMAQSFRQQYAEAPARAFEQLWLSRSTSPAYRAQIYPLFEEIRALSAAS